MLEAASAMNSLPSEMVPGPLLLSYRWITCGQGVNLYHSEQLNSSVDGAGLRESALVPTAHSWMECKEVTTGLDEIL